MAMSRERWKEVEAIYHAAIERPAAERRPFLREACRGDHELVDEVESLLGFDSRGAKLLEQPAAVSAAACPALSPGTRLGAYEVIGPLGAGGMGEVYRARDTRLDRTVALKVLPGDVMQSAERRERFEREARAVSRLSHPHICMLYDVGREGDTDFLVMEYLEGEPLSQRLQREPLPLDEALAYAVQVAEALDVAHRQGVIHRDLKPANVVLTRSGAKLLDFGLAKLISPPGGAAVTPDRTAATVGPADVATRSGQLLGTLHYMSPEQLEGGAVGARADVFAFGCLVFEMLAGERAFRGDTQASVIAAILRDAPPALATRRGGLPEELTRVVDRCLEKDPNARFQSMQEVTEALAILSPGIGDRDRGRRRSPWRGLAIAGGVAVLAAAPYVAMRSSSRPAALALQEGTSAPHIRSIAVLPLDNYSGDPSQDYFAEGMTDELTTQLARIGRLRVISRGSAMQFRGPQRPSTPEIAKALDVDAVVEGSVLRSGDRVRITAQLIDARADRHLWARSFERTSRDVLALQDELASAIARAIHVELTPAEASRLGSAPRVDPEAYDAYLKGRYFFNRPSDENLQRAIARFEESIDLSPTFVPALSGLSDAYLWAGYNEGFLTASEARPRARDAAEQAIRLDDSSAEAHTSLAVFRLFYEYDWAGAEAEFRRAIELNPSYAYAHDQLGIGLAFQGRVEDSIAETMRAAELDPLSPQVLIDGLLARTLQRDYEGARRLAKRSADLDPTYFLSAFSFGWIDIQEGRLKEAILNLEKAKEMESPAFVSAWLAYAYGASGDRDAAQAELEEMEKRSLRGQATAFNRALVSLGLGDHALAVSYLERAYATDSQWLGWLKGDRVFDPLRSDPRFVALLRKLNLAS